MGEPFLHFSECPWVVPSPAQDTSCPDLTDGWGMELLCVCVGGAAGRRGEGLESSCGNVK